MDLFYVLSAAWGDLRINQTFTGPVEGKRKRDRQRKRWTDNNYRGMDREQWKGIIIEEWTGKSGGEEKERQTEETMDRQ